MSQFLLAFDKTTVFESFFVKVKTVTEHPNFKVFSEKEPDRVDGFLRAYKVTAEQANDENYLEEIYQEKAVWNSNYSKIITVCFGFWQMNEEKGTAEKQIKAIAKENEVDTLRILWQVLDKLYRSNKNKVLIGHYLTNFDIPHYCRRIFKHRENITVTDNNGKQFKVGIPDILKKLLVAKPWEQTIVDTSTIFKFGDNTHPTIDEIGEYIGFKRDDDEISNQEINKLYWGSDNKEAAMKEIARVGSSDIEIMMDFMTEMRLL